MLERTSILSKLTTLIHPPPPPQSPPTRDPTASHSRTPSALIDRVPLHNRIRTLDCLLTAFTIQSDGDHVPSPAHASIHNLRIQHVISRSELNLSSLLIPTASKPRPPQLSSDCRHTGLMPEEVFAAWLSEFEACALEAYRRWTGIEKKAHDVFHVLAEGTYRWQKIVPKKEVDQSVERECLEYMIANMNIAIAITRRSFPDSAVSRMLFRRQLGLNGLDRIIQKLRATTSPALTSILDEYNAQKERDELLSVPTVLQPGHVVDTGFTPEEQEEEPTDWRAFAALG